MNSQALTPYMLEATYMIENILVLGVNNLAFSTEREQTLILFQTLLYL